jgi:hypothetical protein
MLSQTAMKVKVDCYDELDNKYGINGFPKVIYNIFYLI